MLFKFDGYLYTKEFDSNFPGYKKKGKYVPVHNYVYWLNTGIIPENNKTCIHHIDGDKENNEFENLILLKLSEHGKEHPPKPPEINKIFLKRMSDSNWKKRLFGFRGATYNHKKYNPWKKVWRCTVGYNKKQMTLGYFHDPLSCEIVNELVREELY